MWHFLDDKESLFFVIFFRLSFDQFPSTSAIFHFFSVADWISSKSDRGIGAGAAPKLEILSTKITSSFMSRDLHQQTLDLFLNLARQGEKAEYIIQWSVVRFLKGISKFWHLHNKTKLVWSTHLTQYIFFHSSIWTGR